MDKRRIFMESVSQLGLNELQFKGVVSLFESCLDDSTSPDDDFLMEPDVYQHKWDPADKAAFEKVKTLFLPVNGKASKLSSSLSRYWDDELMSCGIDIVKVQEYNPEEDRWPKLRISFDGGKESGTLELRADEKGQLSFVIRDEKDYNMNPELYRFEGTDLSKFEDRYECSPKYDINHVKDLFEESVSKVLTFCTIFRDLGPLVMAGM